MSQKTDYAHPDPVRPQAGARQVAAVPGACRGTRQISCRWLLLQPAMPQRSNSRSSLNCIRVNSGAHMSAVSRAAATAQHLLLLGTLCAQEAVLPSS
jgi:hypothetical protein